VSNSWRRIYNNKVLYFDLSSSWEDVIVTDWWNVLWKKTIIVKWGDLYIKWNIEYNSWNDILWIVVLKDENQKGWNLYISPDVTYLSSQIYVDKAIYSWYSSSWDGEDMIIYSVNTNQNILNNQLYIFWQVFSENTIWWSRENPPICPYFDKSSCDVEKAQKYDLNYLRRYYTYDSDNDWTKDSIANSWKYYFNWLENTSYDSSYNYIDYPVVIKYNPMIQITPPPLFK
jgi:hypothetical protein